jgi:hypothetical protein
MELTEQETVNLQSFRNQCVSQRRTYVLSLLIGCIFLLAGLLAGLLSVVRRDPGIFLHAPIYAVFGILTLNSAIVFRNGNPQVILLLRIVDHLTTQDGANSAPVNTLHPSHEASQ